MSQTVEKQIIRRVHSWGLGCVFTPSRFVDLGSRSAVDQALSRLAAGGKIRRLARGLYDYPREHPTLGVLSPDPDAIAKAMAMRDGCRIQPSGAYAANLLGLSQQVPAKVVYLTDGADRTTTVGQLVVQFRRTTPKNMATAGSISGLVIQALRYLGSTGVTQAHLSNLRRNVSKKDRERLWSDRRYAPVWMHRHFDEVRQDERGS